MVGAGSQFAIVLVLFGVTPSLAPRQRGRNHENCERRDRRAETESRGGAEAMPQNARGCAGDQRCDSVHQIEQTEGLRTRTQRTRARTQTSQ